MSAALMLMLLMLGPAPQAEPLGWRCSAQRAVGDHTYRLDRAIEGDRRFPAHLRVSWMPNSSRTERFVEWDYGDPPLSDAPRVINFQIPAARRTSRVVVRMVFPDGTEQSIAQGRGLSLLRSGDAWSFQSLDPDLNRRIWAARNLRAVVEDRRHRALGEIEMDFPASSEVMRLGAELALEVDAKLTDPSRSSNRCDPYGEEAYIDPV